MARMFKWIAGRQGTGYRKMLIAESARFRFDVYLIDYPPGAFVPAHTDPIEGCEHYRANVLLHGEQTFEGEALLRIGPLVVFRPDVTPHAVTRVSRRRVVLSLGLAVHSKP